MISTRIKLNKQTALKVLITSIISVGMVFFIPTFSTSSEIVINDNCPTEKYMTIEEEIEKYVFTDKRQGDILNINKNKLNKREGVKQNTYYDIPLSHDLQDYIREQAELNGLNFETVISVIYVESTFREDVVSYNGTSVGLMQINRYNTLDWLANESNIANVDPYNPYHSVKMGTWYLNYLRNYWLGKEISAENAMKAAFISYHRGLSNAKSYIKRNGYNSNYVNKIFNYKIKLERSNDMP